jgi:hypothetical protein
MQLICNYHGKIMLTSFFIHSSKSNTWHYGGLFFWNIDLHHSLWLFIYTVLDYDTWHSQKLSHDILIEFFKKKHLFK